MLKLDFMKIDGIVYKNTFNFVSFCLYVVFFENRVYIERGILRSFWGEISIPFEQENKEELWPLISHKKSQ